jgi:fructose-1,6-bisphosphatase/inositol monophosphatase family enzyme
MLSIKLNDHAVGIVLKELVRRAIVTIRAERFKFEATAKVGYDGTMEDVFTSADTAAQAVYEHAFRECFPGVGMIGEEESPDIPCTLDDVNAYFTVDPLDGTKAFVRGQSHGTATMVALVVNDEIVSAWIGDINTQEIYGYRPGSEKVHRISEYEVSQYLHTGEFQQDISKSYLLLRDSLEGAPEQVRSLAVSFKKYHTDGGSIGTWMARLWKGEFAGAVLNPAHQTPWDDTPIIGISQKLGFVFLRSDGDSSWEQYQPDLVREVGERPYWTAVIHESNVTQLLST